jgi:hypothetical protein
VLGVSQDSRSLLGEQMSVMLLVDCKEQKNEIRSWK